MSQDHYQHSSSVNISSIGITMIVRIPIIISITIIISIINIMLIQTTCQLWFDPPSEYSVD